MKMCRLPQPMMVLEALDLVLLRVLVLRLVEVVCVVRMNAPGLTAAATIASCWIL
jgi:hypothetical protein